VLCRSWLLNSLWAKPICLQEEGADLHSAWGTAGDVGTLSQPSGRAGDSNGKAERMLEASAVKVSNLQ